MTEPADPLPSPLQKDEEDTRVGGERLPEAAGSTAKISEG